jgi:hypothetical protein
MEESDEKQDYHHHDVRDVKFLRKSNPIIAVVEDIRNLADFKKITFSNYKKVNVCHAFIESILEEDLESACYWSAELICSGACHQVWDLIFLVFSKHIHLENPKLPIYLHNRYESFQSLLEQNEDTLEIRNNVSMREIICETVTVLVFSQKKNKYEPIKIYRENLLDISNKLQAPHQNWVSFLSPAESDELLWATNELLFNISIRHSFAYYWIDWIIEYDALCRTNKTPYRTVTFYSDTPVDNKYKNDTVWLVWDSLFEYLFRWSSPNKSPCLEICLNSLHEFFCVNYAPSTFKKKKHLLYVVVSILSDEAEINWGIPLIDGLYKDTLTDTREKIGMIYEQIKQHEKRPVPVPRYNPDDLHLLLSSANN